MHYQIIDIYLNLIFSVIKEFSVFRLVEVFRKIFVHFRSPLVEKKVKQSKESSETNKKKDEVTSLLQEDDEEKEKKDKDCDIIIQDHKYEPSLSKVFFRIFGGYYIIGNCFKVIHDVVMFITPFLLG